MLFPSPRKGDAVTLIIDILCVLALCAAMALAAGYIVAMENDR